MTTLATVRSYIRTHLDLDSSELPDELVDEFIRDATHYVETFRPWPFMKSRWTQNTADGTFEYPFASLTNASSYRLNRIHAVYLTTDGTQLRYRGDALIAGARTEGQPTGWGTWGDTLVLTPIPDATYGVTIYGERRPFDWVDDGTGTNVFHLAGDFDSPLKTWALGRAYAHQEEGQTAVAFYDLAEFQLRNLATQYATIHPFQGLRVNAGDLDATQSF